MYHSNFVTSQTRYIWQGLDCWTAGRWPQRVSHRCLQDGNGRNKSNGRTIHAWLVVDEGRRWWLMWWRGSLSCIFFFRCSVVLETVSCFHTEHLIHFWASCTVLLCRGGYRSDHYASLSARGQKEAAQDTTDKHRDIFSYGQLRCVTRRLHIVTARKYPHIFPKDSNCVNGQRVADLSACYLGRWYINYRDYLGAYKK